MRVCRRESVSVCTRVCRCVRFQFAVFAVVACTIVLRGRGGRVLVWVRVTGWEGGEEEENIFQG